MPIYLDHAATTYIYPELIEVIKEDLEKFLKSLGEQNEHD